jgi:glycosyltransferase involved in cell wall biosynthesis
MADRVLRIGIAALGSSIGTGGGVDIYTRELVEALADFDKENDYIVLISGGMIGQWGFRDWPPNMSFLIINEIEPQQPILKRLSRKLSRRLGRSIAINYGEEYIIRQFQNLNLDLIHYPKTVISNFGISIPIVLTFFDMQHEYLPQFFTLSELDYRAQSYKPSVDKAAHIIAPSAYTTKTLIEKYGTPIEKISCIPVGLKDSFGKLMKSEIQQVKEKYALPDDFILYPANPWPHKNHARLMAALRIYRDTFGDPPILVLTGRLNNETLNAKYYATAADIEEYVISLDFIPSNDLSALYRLAKMMVFPSLFEGFGIPLLEAMACGCPIVAANNTSIPECVGDAALLFNPFDPKDIANAIYQVNTDAVLRSRLVDAGYKRVKLFSWSEIISQIVNVYQKVALTTNPKNTIY